MYGFTPAALTASLLASAAVAQATTPTVIPIKNFDFGPMVVTVPVGGQVTWKNLDGEPHTVVSTDGQFRSPALDEGDSFTFRFSKPGEYAYICSIHPQMKARIIVR